MKKTYVLLFQRTIKVKVDFHVLMTLLSTLTPDLELAVGAVAVAALITYIRLAMFSKAPASADQARSV